MTLRPLVRTKKAQSGAFLILIVIAIIAVIGILMVLFGSLFKDMFVQLGDSGLDAPMSLEIQEEIEGDIIPILDNFAFWSFIALLLGLIFIAVYSDYHPAIMIIGVIMLIVGVYLAGQYANIYDELKNDSDYGDEFTLSNLAFGRQMPIIIFGVMVIGGVILFGKRRDTGSF